MNLWDDAASPFDFLKAETSVRRVAMSKFGERNIRAGEPITLLQERFAALYFMHRFALNALSKTIGGMEYANAVRGDGQQATRPIAVPAAGERAARHARRAAPGGAGDPGHRALADVAERDGGDAVRGVVRQPHASGVRRARGGADAGADDRRHDSAARPRGAPRPVRDARLGSASDAWRDDRRARRRDVERRGAGDARSWPRSSASRSAS